MAVRVKVSNVEKYGDTHAVIYIPSIYGKGGLIPTPAREDAAAYVRQRFGDIFGGSTGHNVDTDVDWDYTGSFRHAHGPLAGLVVDESIARAWASVSYENYFADPAAPAAGRAKQDVFQLAGEIAVRLDQESVAVEWGKEFYCVEASGRVPKKRWPFRRFPDRRQTDIATIVLRRMQKPRDLAYLLSLNNWQVCEEKTQLPGLTRVAHAKDRSAYSFDATGERVGMALRRKVGGILREGDLVFDLDPDGCLRIWVNRKSCLEGGRRIPPVTPEGKVPRISLKLALALLESSQVPPLAQMLERTALTAAFFAAYSQLQARVAREMRSKGLSVEDAEREAQILVGRLMFLRFIEQKGWLNNDQEFLSKLFAKHPKGFYKGSLVPLFFEVLDVAPEFRSKSRRLDIPYINGGLFRPGPAAGLDLPDQLFDPADKDSVLGVFGRFEFTLDEAAPSTEAVSIDPSMFGHILEGLCSERERKRQGVHYTPSVIGETLARHAIAARLAELGGIGEERMRQFAYGQVDALSPQEAERIEDLLPKLRIIDPAVGSGSLLLAALNELMSLLCNCEKRRGNLVLRGQFTWSLYMRRFIRECLYGVDIDPQAVEVTKLRLWLAMAVGTDEPAPLPDLDYNVRVGDSLSEAPDHEGSEQLHLPLDRLSAARNALAEAIATYKVSDGPLARHAGTRLREAEREYVSQYTAAMEESRLSKQTPTGDTVPFLWQAHFVDIFASANRGFDVVIANPPYVRAQQLAKMPKKLVDGYMKRFKDSLASGAKDLYFAFVEQGLRLAGRAGRVAFIMPNFSRSQTGAGLRCILQERGAVDLWVDFGHIQVFSTASNFVALLFARASHTRRRDFECRCVDPEAWPPLDSTDWVAQIPGRRVAYGEVWRTSSEEQSQTVSVIEKHGLTLKDCVEEIRVGVQTSADVVYLLERVSQEEDGAVQVYSTSLERTFPVENAALRACAKGSAHLKPFRVEGSAVLLWPYGQNHRPLPEEVFEESFPRAWAYLERCRKRLQARSMSKSREDGEKWWRFGREQGIEISSLPKIIVPSALASGCAYFDHQSEVAFTASGKGGGGAWGILPKADDPCPEWLVAVLNSSTVWEWLKVEGDPKKGGWRGVDQSLLFRLPLPRITDGKRKELADRANDIQKAYSYGESPDASMAEIDRIVADLYLGGSKKR